MKFIELIDLATSSDSRGIAIRPISDKELQNQKLFNLHLVSLKPGVVRGNHFHEYQNEVICVFGSRAKVAAVDNTTGDREEEIIEEDRAVMLKIPKNISHAIKNIGNSILYLLCYSDQKYQPEKPDSIANKII